MGKLDRSKQVGGVAPHTTSDPLVVLLYLLMRDHLSAGIFEKLVMEMSDAPMDLTNPFLAQYAENIAERLVVESEAPTGMLSLGPVEEGEPGGRVFRELSEEDESALVGALEIVRRIAGSYESYGGIETTPVLNGLEKLLERFDKEVPL